MWVHGEVLFGVRGASSEHISEYVWEQIGSRSFLSKVRGASSELIFEMTRSSLSGVRGARSQLTFERCWDQIDSRITVDGLHMKDKSREKLSQLPPPTTVAETKTYEVPWRVLGWACLSGLSWRHGSAVAGMGRRA